MDVDLERRDREAEPVYPTAQFRACNRTELFQLCVGAGLSPDPSEPREALIGILCGDPATTREPIDQWRRGLAGFVLDHWDKLEPQITCPLKSKDPQSCWGCPDMQVITCVTQNKQNEQLIRLHAGRKTP